MSSAPTGDDDAVEEMATRLFAMARAGDTEGLDAYVAAGVAANLANDKGDTLPCWPPTTATPPQSRPL